MFENFHNICLKIHKLNPAHFLLAPGLVWQVALKLTDIDMLLMVEKVSQAEYVTLFTDLLKLIINTWKRYDKIKESSHLKYWDINNLHRSAMSQKLPVYGFTWFEEASQFNEEFIKIYERAI